jgi:hypothetical protein
LSEDILAQKRSRLDISIPRNRYMTKQLNSVKEELKLSKARVNEQAGTINQYGSELALKNDSIRTQKECFERALLRANYQIAALDDSLKEYREYRA